MIQYLATHLCQYTASNEEIESRVQAAVTVHDMDVMAELTRMYLQRVTEVFAFEVIQPHPC
jgi:hypothetical protein